MVKRRKNNEVNINIDSSKPTPQAIDVEKAVLGALLIDKDAFDLVSDVLTEESFYNARNKIIFAAIKSIKLHSLPLDILTVTEELEKQGKLEEVGGPGYVVELSSRVASSANIEYHAGILAEKDHYRQLIKIGAVLCDKSYSCNDTADDLHEEAEKALFELSQKGNVNTTVELFTSLKESIKQMQAAQSHPDGITGVPSGFGQLDNMTAGFQPSDLIILAGRPAMGKTSLAVNMAFSMAANGIPVAFFTLEMSHVQLTNRIVSAVCEIPGQKILKGTLSTIDWDRIDKNVNAMERPLYIDDTPSLSIFQIRSKARHLIRAKGVKIIFVDYLQLMTAGDEIYGTRQEEVSTVSKALKALAKELNVPVIALSQLNRGIESRDGLEGKRPRLSDLRESGSIEQDADMVMFVHRPEYYHIYQDESGKDLRGKAQIIIAKHRKGATGDVLLTFRSEFTRFDDDSMPPLPSSPYSSAAREPFPQTDDSDTIIF